MKTSLTQIEQAKENQMNCGIEVAIWPDHFWVSLEEVSEFTGVLSSRSDDYVVVTVSEWEEDGSPASKYFEKI